MVARLLSNANILNPERPSSRMQYGFALLLFLFVLLIAGSAVFVTAWNRQFARLAVEARTAEALSAAKAALIARAAQDRNRPGSLPCPDTNGDGVAEVFAGNDCPQYYGWFPWKTLATDDLRDSTGERLWYILSPKLRDDPSAQPINTSVTTTLTLDGLGGIAALVIAPGAAVSGQNRPSNNIRDYLDDAWGNAATSNRDGDDSYFSGPGGSDFNDQVSALYNVELFAGVAPRILGEIRSAYVAGGSIPPDADTDGDGLSNAGSANGTFPYLNPSYALIPSPSDTSSTTWYADLVLNNWFPLVAYDRNRKTITLNGITVTLP